MKLSVKKDYNVYPFKNLHLIDMPGEEWLSVPQFDGYLLVSNMGRVWGKPRPVYSITGQFYYTKERIKKQALVKTYNQYIKGYTEQLSVRMRYEGINHSLKVNRLVYDLFVSAINFKEDGLLVVHKNGDNCDNRPENLVLMNGTQLYRHGLNLEKRPKSGSKIKKATHIVWNEFNLPRPVVQYTLDGKKIKEFESIAQAAEQTGHHRASMRTVLQKKLKQLNGFVYRFSGDEYKGEHAGFSYEKPVRQYTLDGKQVGQYPSVQKAASQTGIDRDIISSCARRKIRLGSGYIWRYAGDNYSGEYRDTVKNQRKALIQYNLDGQEVARFKSINQAVLETGFTAGTLADCAYKRSKVSHGFVWRFEGEEYQGEYRNYRIGKPVTQYSKGGELLGIYASIEAAARATGLTADNIQKNVHGHNKTAGGFVWKFASENEIKQLPDYTRSEYKSSIKLTPVIQYSIEGKRLARYSSITEGAKVLQINYSNIKEALNKAGRSSFGYVWRTEDMPYSGELALHPPKSKGKMVTQYDLEGVKLAVFKSTRDAERNTGANSATISAVANGKLKKTVGYIWQYGDGPDQLDLYTHFASTRMAIERASKPVVQYTIEGELVAEYPSIAAAARAEGISMSSISGALGKKRKSSGGFLWEFKELANS